MANIAIENFTDVYQYTLDIRSGMLDHKKAKEKIVKSGMNENSANKYFVALDAMLDGQHYGSTINSSATIFFLDNILKDFGLDGLENALKALKSHIDYQEGKNNLPSLKKIYNRYLKSLGDDLQELPQYAV